MFYLNPSLYVPFFDTQVEKLNEEGKRTQTMNTALI